MIRSFETFNGKQTLKVTYSDQQLKIRQVETGNIYSEATDIMEANYTYEETDELIPVMEDENISEI